jgi:hypothetical protein
MFLRVLALSVILVACEASAQIILQPEHQWSDDVVGSHTLQVGVDAWRIRTSDKEDTTANMNSLSRLQLANSYPVWDYTSSAPWMRFEGGLRVGDDVLMTMKYRADQSTGARLDEASVDWSFHTYGLKAGVVDPKISWCRTYDVDSPWVRENNPFCAIKPLIFARGSSPGLQTYANFIAGDYSLQAIAGVYRPLMFNYEEKESPTIILSSSSQVTQRHKTGLALSATNLRNGTEFRFSLMRDAYTAYRPSDSTKVARTTDFSADVVFLAGAWYITPKMALRGSYFMYSGDLNYTEYDRVTYLSLHDDKKNSAKTLELNYQASASHVYSLAYAVYNFNIDQNLYKLIGNAAALSSSNSGAPTFVTSNTSISWRRDWGGQFFTVLQLSNAKTTQSDSARGLAASSNGRALGLRLGYRF